MKNLLLAVLTVVFPLICVSALASESKTKPSGKELIEEMLRLLPSEIMSLNGKLVVRDKTGIIQRLNITVDAQWQNMSAKLVCRISGADGNFLEQMVIEEKKAAKPEIVYTTDGNTSDDESFLLYSIGKTDLAWIDISMSFLWWPHADVLKEDQLRGRNCYVLSLKPPEYFTEYYSHVLLWIDKETGMFIQAEYYDKNGERLRKMWVKSIKKINGKWFVKDIEAETYPALTRTTFLVNSLKAGGVETIENEEE